MGHGTRKEGKEEAWPPRRGGRTARAGACGDSRSAPARARRTAGLSSTSAAAIRTGRRTADPAAACRSRTADPATSARCAIPAGPATSIAAATIGLSPTCAPSTAATATGSATGRAGGSDRATGPACSTDRRAAATGTRSTRADGTGIARARSANPTGGRFPGSNAGSPTPCAAAGNPGNVSAGHGACTRIHHAPTVVSTIRCAIALFRFSSAGADGTDTRCPWSPAAGRTEAASSDARRGSTDDAARRVPTTGNATHGDAADGGVSAR